MSYSYQIDVPDNLVRVKATGVCTYADVLALSEAIAADPALVKGMPSLVDYTGARLEASDEEIRAYAERMRALSERRGNAKIAAVTAHTGVTDFIVRFFDIMSEVYRSPIRARTFDDVAAAERWLRERDG